MTIQEMIEYGKNILEKNNIDEAILKTKMLIEYALGKSREYIMIHWKDEIEDSKREIFEEYIDRASKNEPIQYIIGKQEFMGLEFEVNNKVLIPRSDTETLVLEIIEIVKNNASKNFSNILDMCTGSGAIIVSLAKYLKDYKIEFYASDISEDAIEVAKRNSIKNSVDVKFIKSDIFENIEQTMKFDLIVSNPPYIETEVIKGLDENVKQEPYIALDGGRDGLDFYRKIAEEGKEFLNESGYLCFEIGYNQKETVSKILEDNNYKEIKCIKDLGGNDRVIICRKG